VQTPFAALRVTFAILAAGTLVVGYVGMYSYLTLHAEFAHSPLDVLYSTLQLFVLEPPPLDAEDPLPWTLQFARFAAPAVAIYALIETTRLLLTAEIRRLRARESRHHTVVCGDGPAAQALIGKLHAAGRRVVVVTTTPATMTGYPRVLHVTGDPRDPKVLRAAGVHRAEVLYACEAGSFTNTGIVMAAHTLAETTPGVLRAYALIPDLDLCTALRARRLGMPDPPGLRLDFFNLDQLAARVLLDRYPVEECLPITLIGLDDFGLALIVELARRWRLRVPSTQPPLPVTVVDSRAETILPVLRRRYEFVDANLDLRTVDPGHLDQGVYVPADPPHRVYVCHHDEDLTLKTALTALRLWTRAPKSMVIRVEQGMVGAAFDGLNLLENLNGTLHVFAVTDEAGDPRLIGEDLIEQLARAIHEDYLHECLIRGDSPHGNTAMVAWDELPASLRKANCGQAADIGRKLKAIDGVLAPRVDPEFAFAFTPQEIERLAVMEHQRWVRERVADGWTYDTLRDDAGKHHPDLEDWSRLPEPSREKDRAAVRSLPGILATTGFQIVRMGDRDR
jgi:RyR domain-containing protein/TrkA family protein